MATFIYGLFNRKGECLYIGQTAQPKIRFESHKSARFRTVPCKLRVLRECRTVKQGNKVEVQIMKAYRKRGQASMNRVLRAMGNYEGAKPDKLISPLWPTLTPAERKARISKIMRMLGKQTSAKKKRSSRANLQKAWAAKKEKTKSI